VGADGTLIHGDQIRDDAEYDGARHDSQGDPHHAGDRRIRVEILGETTHIRQQCGGRSASASAAASESPCRRGFVGHRET
jgi:hypothetical protein